MGVGPTRQVYIPKTLRPVADTWVRNDRHALDLLEEVSSAASGSRASRPLSPAGVYSYLTASTG